VGGLAAHVTQTDWGSRSAALDAHRCVFTANSGRSASPSSHYGTPSHGGGEEKGKGRIPVGAALKWVMPSSFNNFQIRG
jgi:hypothetical protein